jgi:arylsulfatase A-like enzyme
VGTRKHISDALGDALEETLAQLASGDAPFYLQFHSYAVHGPVLARPDLKQAAKVRLGDRQNGRMIEYVAFIAGMDENLGRILAAIKDPNGDGDEADSIAENTLVLFTSDNGGTHAENTPLRGKKGMFTEGGIRVPLVDYWPGVIPADTVTGHTVHSVDYYPTYLELAGKNWMPPESTHPLDGSSFADVLRQPQTERIREPVFYLFPGYMDTRAEPCAVVIDQLDGKRYKLLYFYEADAWQLYCLSDDPGEAVNLFPSHPEIAAPLSRKIRTWLSQKHSTWQPAYPLDANSGQPVGPPPVL